MEDTALDSLKPSHPIQTLQYFFIRPNMMQAVQVLDWADGPELTTIPRPDPPSTPSTAQLQIRAVGLHQLVKTRATGRHYTSGPLPHTPGVDGVGVDVQTGKRVYFHTFDASSDMGTYAEYVDVPRDSTCEIPEGMDSVLVAGLMNPIMSSWMALRTRAPPELAPGWTCLILGATSMSGRLAVHVARKMGAERVYGAARRESALAEVDGLDGRVVLDGSQPGPTEFGGAAAADVVLDYLWGPWPSVVLSQPGVSTATTWLSIGNVAGSEAGVPGPVPRVRDVTIRGSGPRSWAPLRMDEGEMAGMMGLLGEVKGKFEGDVKGFGIGRVEELWGRKERDRVVFAFEDGQTG